MSLKVQSLIVYAFQALLILVPLAWTSATSELFEFPKMLLTYAGSILIAGLWIARMIVEKRIIYKS